MWAALIQIRFWNLFNFTFKQIYVEIAKGNKRVLSEAEMDEIKAILKYYETFDEKQKTIDKNLNCFDLFRKVKWNIYYWHAISI